ncbi:phosphoglucomutase [Fulvitalea axinellae]|uniref:Phosphoglucomutase n=1 Tax=Fulvitalea axinellae TaxID=1182444 RepID=A0AAU9CSG4_9BACT|nr:phosphoglucomutase [Fulvitalea axinellae]
MADKAILDKANEWLTSDSVDEETKAGIRQMIEAEDQTELTDAFYKDLEFGTGGLRGIMGVGSNRMNRYTVGKATQGLSNYISASFPGETTKVAIAYDSRNNNKLFADVTASVLSANGIEVYVFEEVRPTPELSFAVRHLDCNAGIVITASHNPKEYNGYKVYWNDGAQIVAPHDKNIITEVNAISDLADIKFEKDPARIHTISDSVDKAYIQSIKDLSLSPEAVQRQKELKLVFTPIHGSGITMVPRALEAYGFTNVHIVEEQATLDGNFPTVPYPNPEETAAMQLGLDKAKALDADILFATDPDADRVGVGMKNHHGEWQLLNGNQTAALLTYYLLEKWKENGKIDGKEYIVYTIVTSDLLGKIAEGYGVEYFTTLTGFKFIAGVIRDLEGKRNYIGGGEESYGYLVGDAVRDKDAVSACVMFAEMTAYFKDKGLSAFDVLIDMYSRFGFYYEELVSLTEKGKAGAEAIQKRMADMRQEPPKELAGETVTSIIDYANSTEKNLVTGETSAVDFPSSNVLQFITNKGSKISARPSGTEPKIKFYFSVNGDLADKNQFDETLSSLKEKIKALKADLGI